MARQARARRRRIRLDGIALIKQPLVIKLLQEPPKGFYILVVIRDVGMVEVNPITHLLRKVAPLGGELHHILTAFLVIVFNRNILVRLLIINVGLRYAKLLLYAKLHGQPVSVPASLAVNLVALHCLVTVERILYGTRQHMVDAGMAVCRGRSLKEYELGASLTLCYRFTEHVVLAPFFQYRLVSSCQVETFMFGKFVGHIYITLIYMRDYLRRKVKEKNRYIKNFA